MISFVTVPYRGKYSGLIRVSLLEESEGRALTKTRLSCKMRILSSKSSIFLCSSFV